MATIPVVNIIDNRKGIISGVLAVLLLLLYLWFFTFEMADPPPPPLSVKAETQFPEEIVLKDLVVEGGSGGGKASDDPVDRPKPLTQEVITGKTETTTPTGNASNTNAQNSQETNTTTQQSNDPFASGGSGQGEDGGSGDTFGTDTGTGTEGTHGGGSGSGRIRLNDPIVNDLRHSSIAYIYLKLTIDSQGNVISAFNITAKTTTTDQKLINRVMYEVKKQVKYNKDPGSSPVNVYLPAVVIKAK